MTRLQRRINVVLALIVSAALLALLGGVLWVLMLEPWVTLGVAILGTWLGLAGVINKQIEREQMMQAMKHLERQAQGPPGEPAPSKDKNWKRPRRRGPPKDKFPQPTVNPSH